MFEGSSWFGYGRKTYWLPSLWTYAGHIRKTDGLGGLFRGLSPKIVQGIVQQVVAQEVNQILPVVHQSQSSKHSPAVRDALTFCKETGRASVVRSVAVVAGYPFEVVSVRMIAYYVGREEPYSTVFGAVREIYRTNGLAGFFAGLVPRLLCEICSLWGFEVLSGVIIRSIGLPSRTSERREMEAYVRSIAQYVVRMVTYPFMLTSTLMIVDGSGMQAAHGIPFDGHGSWFTCLSSLHRHGLMMRGSNLLRRPVMKGTAV